jgi:hypothetical protein
MVRKYSSTIVTVPSCFYNFSVLRNGTFFDGWRACGRLSHFYRLSFSNSGGEGERLDAIDLEAPEQAFAYIRLT